MKFEDLERHVSPAQLRNQPQGFYTGREIIDNQKSSLSIARNSS
jgi:hypothetical protein